MGKPILLKPATLGVIDELTRVEWFAHVGEQINDSQIARVFTWEDALKYCRSRYSSNVQIESSNLLTEQLCLEYPQRYQDWNKIGNAVGDIAEPLFRHKTDSVIKARRLPKTFLDT